MITKFLALCLFGLMTAPALLAQQSPPLIVAFMANATTLPTHPKGIFISPHPGLLIGTSFRYNKSNKNQLYQTLKAGYIFHQFVHHTVQLYSELEYKRMFGQRMNLSGALGAGYAHLFPATEVFRRAADGRYEKMPATGRPQAMASLALGAGYLLKPGGGQAIEIFTRYQFFVQGPFVRQYVPILPNTALQLGLLYPLFQNAK